MFRVRTFYVGTSIDNGDNERESERDNNELWWFCFLFTFVAEQH